MYTMSRIMFTYMQTHTYICTLYIHICNLIFIYIFYMYLILYSGLLTGSWAAARGKAPPGSLTPPSPHGCGSRAPAGQWGGCPNWKIVFLVCENVNIYFWLLCTSDFSTWECLGDTCLLATHYGLIKLISIGLFCMLYGKRGISKWFILFIFKERTERKWYNAETL